MTPCLKCPDSQGWIEYRVFGHSRPVRQTCPECRGTGVVQDEPMLPPDDSPEAGVDHGDAPLDDR